MGDRRTTRGIDRGDNDVSATSGVIDIFTRMDRLLENANDTLSDISSKQDTIVNMIGGDSTHRRIGGRNELPLYSDAIIDPGEKDEDSVKIPKDGKLIKVILTFPQGSNQSVGIGVKGVDGESLVPFGPAGYNYVALSGDSVTFNFDYDVQKGESLTVKYVNNRDPDRGDEFTAFPSAILVMEEGA